MIPFVACDRFVGRMGELARVEELVLEVASGAGGVLLVVGEQGVGKTALLAEGLARAQVAGCRVGWQAADELRMGFPLWLIAGCLGAEGQEAVVGGGGGDRWLAGPVLGGDPVLAGVERLLAGVDRLCAVSPVVVVAEDLQWADEASLLVWRRLVRAAGQLPLGVVGSVRPVPARGEVEQLRWAAAGAGVVMDLGPLPAPDVAELARGLLGAVPGPRLAGVLCRAGGNPLYVRELVDALVRERRVAVAAGVAELAGPGGLVAVPGSLVAAITERLEEAPAEVVEALRWAAVLGAEFTVTDLSLVSGRPAGDLAGVLELALAAGIVAEAGPQLGFRHALIRQVLYEQIPPVSRDGLHLAAARVLAGAGAAPEVVAAQLLAVPQVGEDWVWAWLAEAVGLLGYRAPQVAARLLRRAVGQVAVTDPLREVLETALVQVAFSLGQDEEVERVARPLLARTTDPGTAAQASWLLACTLGRTGRGGESAAVIDRVLARPGVSGAWRARLGGRQAVWLWETGLVDEAEEAARRVLADAEQAGDRYAAGYAWHVLSLVASRRLDQGAMLDHIERALAMIGDDPQAAELRVLLLSNQAGALGFLDRRAEADRAIREALSVAEQAGNLSVALIRIKAAENYFDVGRWDDAVTMLDAAARLPGPDHLPLRAHGLAALIAGHRDDPAIDEHLAAVRDETLTSPRHQAMAHHLLLARALAAERAGRTHQAVAELSPILDPEFTSVIQAELMLPSLARVALGAGDTATAAAAARAAQEEADRELLPIAAAAARWCRGLADGDPGPVLAAAAYYQATRRRFYHANTLEDAAVLLAARGEVAEARRACTEAARLYRDLGAAWDLRRASARLRRYGIRPRRGGRQPRAATGWDALTPTETKIAALVAEGQSNPDIATELFLSRNTVQTHVSHILAKLGARSRADIIRQTLEDASTHR
jgi:DNA-binding CsgD family transcriptional regulator